MTNNAPRQRRASQVVIAAGFASGILIVALMPSAWLFVQTTAEESGHGSGAQSSGYACPMFCTVMQELPEDKKCPVCGMEMTPISASPSIDAHERTMIGLEVDSAIDRAEGLRGFTVGRVVEAKPHPDADRLSVCTVDTGSGTVDVVCGAPNARTGMKGVFAPVGSFVPGTGMKLKKTKIRGVESNGMLLSEREMNISADHEGIVDLPDDAGR